MNFAHVLAGHRPARPSLVAALLLALASGCHTYAPRAERPSYPPQALPPMQSGQPANGRAPLAPGAGRIAPLEDELQRFAAEVAGASGEGEIGCLPLVSLDARRAEGPWFSELGVEIADTIAGELVGRGVAPQRVLASADMGLRLARANLERAELSSLEALERSAGRLGVDVLVCGRIERRDRVGSVTRDVLTLELVGYDARAGRVLARDKRELPSDQPGLERVWELAQAESSWTPGGQLLAPEQAPSLQREVDVLAGQIAEELAPKIVAAQAQGRMYVAPTDSSRFVRSIARVRAGLELYASELARRRADAEATGKPLDSKGPITLEGVDFPDLQALQAYLLELVHTLRAIEAVQFGRSVASALAEALGPRVTGRTSQTGELYLEDPADRLLLAGALADGELALAGSLREALEQAGIGVLVSSSLDEIGGTFVLRVRATMVDGGEIASASAPIPARFEPELRKALGTSTYGERLQSIDEVGATTRSSWEQLFPRVRSGVAHVRGPAGRGTGFFVREDGLLLTNSHVVHGAGTPLVVEAADGTTLGAEVLSDDPAADLCLLRIPSVPRGAHVFAFGEQAAVGSEIAVLGHPRDTQGWVLTPGHVSSLDERMPDQAGGEQPRILYTCATRQGSSGSPVLALDGSVVAIHCAGQVAQSLSGAQAVTELTGFALGIPAREGRRMLASVPLP